MAQPVFIYSDHQRGYLTSAGTWSPWRKDARRFPSETAGAKAIAAAGMVNTTAAVPNGAYTCSADA